MSWDVIWDVIRELRWDYIILLPILVFTVISTLSKIFRKDKSIKDRLVVVDESYYLHFLKGGLILAAMQGAISLTLLSGLQNHPTPEQAIFYVEGVRSFMVVFGVNSVGLFFGFLTITTPLKERLSVIFVRLSIVLITLAATLTAGAVYNGYNKLDVFLQ